MVQSMGLRTWIILYYLFSRKNQKMKNTNKNLWLLVLTGLILMVTSGCIEQKCTDKCTEQKCEDTFYYECVKQADGCNDFINMGKVEGKCNYTLCNLPYIKVSGECCIDENINGICDKDETIKSPECGDGKCDLVENSTNCCKDCRCPTGKECKDNKCMDLQPPEICDDGRCGNNETSDTCCKGCVCLSGKVCRDDKCEELGEPKITLEVDGKTASGKVNGIYPSEYDNYRVLVYTETDLLYIQPLITPSSARYIKIKSDGSWSVSGLKGSYKVWAFLIKEGSSAPDRLAKGQTPVGVIAKAVK